MLVSTNIYNAQLSRMSHCAPVARKPICLEFTPEAAVGNILVAQVSCKAIPDTRPRDSETSVTECVCVCVRVRVRVRVRVCVCMYVGARLFCVIGCLCDARSDARRDAGVTRGSDARSDAVE